MSSYGIALGHHAANPAALHLLSPPLFARFESNAALVETFAPLYALAGDGSRVAAARPQIAWTLALTEAEWDYLRSTFFAASESPLLTIRTRHGGKAGKPFERWNVIGAWNDLERKAGSLALPGAFWWVELAFSGGVSLGA
jgi:hypothetical protein